MTEFVGVVVPAHDEEDTIESCLRAVEVAGLRLGLSPESVRTVVVADACSDRTAERASRCGAEVIEVKCTNVGRARATGLEHLHKLAAGIDSSQVWLAMTDADTIVGPSWLERQLAWRRRGFDAVAGTVTVGSWHEQPAAARAAFEARQLRLGLGLAHRHVHGANLGFTAEAYHQAGGMPNLALAEDHALWEAFARAGAKAVAAPDLAVTTSARREGRAPGGFSDLLRRLGQDSHEPHDAHEPTDPREPTDPQAELVRSERASERRTSIRPPTVRDP